jgi:hypothetical protein
VSDLITKFCCDDLPSNEIFDYIVKAAMVAPETWESPMSLVWPLAVGENQSDLAMTMA